MWHSEISLVVTSGKDQNGWYGVQVEGYGGKDSGASPLEMQSPFGFTSWPLDADIDPDGNVSAGCHAVTLRRGRADGVAVLGHDPRFSDKCPPGSKGSSALWNARGDNWLIDYAEKRATLYVSTEDGSSAHAWTIGRDPNGDQVINLQHSGGGFILLKNASSQLRGPGSAYVDVKANEVNLNGNSKVLGSLGVGGAAGILPVALHAPLLAYFTASEALLMALATALDAKSPPSPGASVGTVTAFIGAATALKAAIRSQFLTTA